jgi:hypothetical protein
MEILNYEQWCERFKPAMNAVSGYLIWTECRDPDFLARTDIDPRYWWTSKDSETSDSVFYENGFGYANRIQYIECQVPWEGKAQTIQVQDDDLRFGDDDYDSEEE